MATTQHEQRAVLFSICKKPSHLLTNMPVQQPEGTNKYAQSHNQVSLITKTHQAHLECFIANENNNNNTPAEAAGRHTC